MLWGATDMLHTIAGPIDDDDNYYYDDYDYDLDPNDYEIDYPIDDSSVPKISNKIIRAPRVDSNQCTICFMDDVSLCSLECCAHRFCKDCLGSYIKYHLESSHIQTFDIASLHREGFALVMTIDRVYGFTCPHIGCPKPIKDEEFSKFVDVSYCERLRILRKYESDLLNHKKVMAWAKRKNGLVRLCPNCFTPIEKNGGCNHMKCTNCKIDFQWTDTKLKMGVKKTKHKDQKGQKFWYEEEKERLKKAIQSKRKL